MHSSKFKDPWISRAQPVTMLVPVLEETLRTAGVATTRDPILDLFMTGHPRIAVVHGGEDHPPNFGMKETIRRVIRQIWSNGALPFEIAQTATCEELAHGTDAAGYALLSRNLCTTSLAGHIEAHGYDAAIVIGACDKMLVGDLRALAEADLARQKRKARPMFALVLPSVIGREVFATEEEKRRFDPLRSRIGDSERFQLDELLQRPLKPNVYAALKCVLDRCFHHRVVSESEKDELNRVIVRCAATPGASCASSEASMVHRMIVASFGIVPRHLDISVKAPADEQVSDAVKRLLTAIQKRERRVSVAGLIRSNLGNAVSVWSATGGHPAWLLHLLYLADAVGKKLTVADAGRRARSVPQILSIREEHGNSVYTMAQESEAGGNSGIDTIMRTLAEKRLIEDRAPTLDGSWMQRIMEARSANGNFLHSTMTPFSTTCGTAPVQGNVCSGGIVRFGLRGRSALATFDRKLYLAAYYLGTKDLNADLANPEGVLDRLKSRISRDDLYYTAIANWNALSPNGTPSPLDQMNKPRLWDYLRSHDLLRVMVVVAGLGPHAAGMPELDFSNTLAGIPASIAVVLTDGRVSYQYDGISIAHVVPEAGDGGALASIRTGDWIYLDLAKGELQVVRELARHRGFRPLSLNDLMNRPDKKKRVQEIAKQRMELVPSFRLMLDAVSSADGGVSPKPAPGVERLSR